MNYLALGTALAYRYDPANVTPPTKPSGGSYDNIVASTVTPPNTLARFPYVVVWPNEGTLIVGSGQVLGRPQEFLVNFYYAKTEGDLPREETALLSWLGVLLAQTFPALQLGYTDGTVLKAIPVKWTIGALVYAGMTYDGITITIHIWTNENVTLTP